MVDYLDYMKFYEQTRLASFRDAKPGYYSIGDIREAYYNWATAVPGKRTLEWESYCDARDGYAEGTNTAMRRKFEESSKLHHSEPRYVSLK